VLAFAWKFASTGDEIGSYGRMPRQGFNMQVVHERCRNVCSVLRIAG